MRQLVTQYKDFVVPVLAAILAFVGGLLGAQVQLPLNVQLEQQKTLMEARQAAYGDFFEGQVKASILERYPNASEEMQKNLIRVAKAKFFVAVYSSKPTAEAMAHYWDTYLTPKDAFCGPRDKFRADVQIYQQMRRELFG